MGKGALPGWMVYDPNETLFALVSIFVAFIADVLTITTEEYFFACS